MITNRISKAVTLLKKYAPQLTVVLLSTVVAAPLHAAPCADQASDPDGDGWGYENGQSCTVQSDAVQPASGNNCVDDDGDGWGWNGVESCLVEAQSIDQTQLQNNTTSDAAVTTPAGVCVDDDGDGWGWNGVESCLVTSQATAPTSATAQPQVQVQSLAIEPPVEAAIEPVIEPSATQNPTTNEFTTSCAATLSSGANLYNAIASTNGKICLRPGNYSLPNTLSFRSNQTLIAQDPSNPPVISTSAVRTLSTTGRNNVTIESIIIDGNGNGAREFGILVGSGSSNITIRNVVIRNTYGIGIGIPGATNVAIRGGLITNIGQNTRLRQAIWTAQNSRNISIDGLTVRGRTDDVAGGDHAITCIDVNGFSVTNTRTEYAGSGAVAINNCSNIVVSNNELHNGREHGVDIVNGSVGATVTGNNITGFDRSAMVFDDHDWQCGAGCGDNPTEITVSNNRMSGNNLVNLARCKGIAVDSQMIINPTQSQTGNNWVRITADNQIDSDSSLYCQHIH